MRVFDEIRRFGRYLLGKKSEVEECHFRRPSKITQRLDRVRRMNGLI
ncbi:MAG: hypothetical protein V2I67_02210 [Thermoanaerobaculales bacterium]|nr:hypothetical protein [Thermoanaerobaculales bacterium]